METLQHPTLTNFSILLCCFSFFCFVACPGIITVLNLFLFTYYVCVYVYVYMQYVEGLLSVFKLYMNDILLLPAICFFYGAFYCGDLIIPGSLCAMRKERDNTY